MISTFLLAFLLGSVGCSFQLAAQSDTIRNWIDRDKDRYERIMEIETAKSRPKASNLLHQYYLIADRLPEWFFNPSLYVSAPAFFIGISEPGMDSVKATGLAVLRAKSLAVLSTGARIDNISDNFQVTRESQQNYEGQSQYLDFSRLNKQALVGADDFKTIKKHYTKYGEAIALVSYTPDEGGKDTLTANGEIMQLSREDHYQIENTVLCRLDIAFSPFDSLFQQYEKSHFLFKGKGDHFNMVSLYNMDSLKFPAHPYRYVQAEEAKTDTSLKLLHNPLNLGLWNAYINLVFSSINYFGRKLESRVKTSFDHYDLKNQGIVRTVARNRFSFSLDKVFLHDNELYLKLQFDAY